MSHIDLSVGTTVNKIDLTLEVDETSVDLVVTTSNVEIDLEVNPAIIGLNGDKGDDGNSAYQVAVKNGFVGTEQEWLDSLQGADGQDGQDGQNGESAYQIWLDEGNTGTEQDFLDSLKGSPDTALEVKTKYESNPDTNAFTNLDKSNLDNQSGVNTGDEDSTSIQTKRPLKTVNSESLEGSGNIDINTSGVQSVSGDGVDNTDPSNPVLSFPTPNDIGLGNVDNTSDLDKPISTATQTAFSGKANSVHTHIKSDITDFNEADYATAAQGNLADSAIQPGDNVSELVNDAGYLTSFTETDPVFSASEAANFVTGDKANLDNQSGTNTGDETTSSIQSKRPLKTVNGTSLEGSGDIVINGGGTSINFFQVQDSSGAGQTLTSTAYIDVNSSVWNTAFTGTGFSWDGNELTVNDASDAIEFNVSIQGITTLNNRVELGVRLMEDTGSGYTTLTTVNQYALRNNTQDEGNVTLVSFYTFNVASGTKYKIQVNRTGVGCNIGTQGGTYFNAKRFS